MNSDIAKNLIPGVKKIAVLRANALGDFIFSLPAFDALRAAYPRAEIVLLGRAWHREYLAGRPSPIDRVVVIPFSRGIHDPPGDTEEDGRELELFFIRVRRERFDVAVQMHGGGAHSNPFVSRIGARTTAGMQAPGSPALDRTVSFAFYHPEILRCLEVVSLLGARPVRIEPGIAVTRDDIREAEELIGPLDESFAVLHPGAGDPRRHWPSSKFAAVGDDLAERGFRVLISGGEDERELGEKVCGMMRRKSRNISGLLSLSGLTGLLARSGMIVSNDSGPLHLARAVGAPTVGLYWVGNAINAGPVTLMRNRIHLSWRLNCPVCGANCIEFDCPHRESFVADIPVSDVLDSVNGLLSPFSGMRSREITGKAFNRDVITK